MTFISVTESSVIRPSKILYWVPPGLAYGESRYATGYMVDALPPSGSSGDFASGVGSIAVPDSLVMQPEPVNTVTTTYSAQRGPDMQTAGLETATTGATTRFINRPWRYGPRIRDTNLNNNNRFFLSCRDADIIKYAAALYPGSLASAFPGQFVYSDALRSTFSLSGSETRPFFGTIVQIDTDVSSATKTFFYVQWNTVSPGQLPDQDKACGLRGSARARVKVYDSTQTTTINAHDWRPITGWEDADNNEMWRVLAPVLASDRPCADFAFDVTFPAPVGSQRVIYTCESRKPGMLNGLGSDSGFWLCYPILTRRTIGGTAPAAGYSRNRSAKPMDIGYGRTSTVGGFNNLVPGQWRESSGCAGWWNILFMRHRWDADPNFNVRKFRPIPTFYELDQAVSFDIVLLQAAAQTDYEIAWGYSSDGLNTWTPITTAITASVPAAPTSDVTVTLPAPTSIPAIPGQRYTVISRRKVAPSGSFDSWDILYSGIGIGGAMTFMKLPFMLPRVYRWDVRQVAGLPSDADAVPANHYGYATATGQVLLPDTTPSITGTWSLAYLTSGFFQVNSVPNTISGTPTYGSAWAFTTVFGYKFRVSFPTYDSGQPVSSYTVFNNVPTATYARFWKPSPTITSADYDLWRMAFATCGAGEDFHFRLSTAVEFPLGRLWHTQGWRQSLAV